LNVEFLDTFGETVAEFRERCKASEPESISNAQQQQG
jgi:hypothetical protein